MKNLGYFGMFVGGIGMLVLAGFAVATEISDRVERRKRKKEEEEVDVWPTYDQYKKEVK